MKLYGKTTILLPAFRGYRSVVAKTTNQLFLLFWVRGETLACGGAAKSPDRWDTSSTLGSATLYRVERTPGCRALLKKLQFCISRLDSASPALHITGG